MQFYDAFLLKTLYFIAFFARRIFTVKNRCFWIERDSRLDPPFFGHFFPTEAHARNTPPPRLVAGGWWRVAGGWWLAGWWLVAGLGWLVAGGWLGWAGWWLVAGKSVSTSNKQLQNSVFYTVF